MKSWRVFLWILMLCGCDVFRVKPLVSSKTRISQYCTNGGLSVAELELVEKIQTYRISKGLKPIPLSASLTVVAQQHARDLQQHKPDQGNCNTHSWSANGKWSACCYTADHARASCMWKKPSELTSYSGKGYEIAYYYSLGATPEKALQGWKNSPRHNSLLINNDVWQNVEWRAMGVGIYGNYATVWFGIEKDKNGPPPPCNR
ncbi:MAG: CAP domain-containing protein [Cytophagales bacterium]|nr:CAP domain-containing protein [Cytophagales bacterium]MDW8383545.1 CAP domain-containing protein [Flammeovirgaceae bacterium]